VTAHNPSATSAATFDFVRIDTCPDAWGCADINGPAVPGTQYLSNGIWSFQGVGSDIGGAPNPTQDQFRYAWQNVIGDSGLSAQLTSQIDTGTQAKAGLMYRAGSDAGAPYYMIAMTANNGIVVQARTTAGGSSATMATSSATAIPIYLQIVRTNNTFTALTSSDDKTWAPIANSSVDISAMDITAQLGFAVDSYDSHATSTASFTGVDITGTLGSDTSPASGTDLWNLDTHTAHYSQGTNGLIHLQLYNSPVGIPYPTQWQQRDTTLSTMTATGMIAPASMPFTETIAPSSTGMTSTNTNPMLASVASEDGVTLSVGLAATVVSPTPLTGQVHTNAVTYAGVESSDTTPSTSPSDLSLRATESGLDARVVMHSSSETGPFMLTLAVAPSTQLAQNPDGTIRATRTITDYGDDGVTPYTTTQTEYLLQTPILVDSSTDPAALVSTGPATATLISGPSGQATVRLDVDQSWLNSSGRAFPVNLDLPIVTAYSAVHTGVFGTINSCAPNTIAPQTEMIVGAEGSCAYHGEAYYDLSPLQPDTSVASATLRMYTPDPITATGVQIYPNAPTATADPLTQPSWNSAPVVVTGSVGLPQTGSDGHWQSWDVTSLVQQWVQDGTTNAGLTLVGTGLPLRFASPLGAGSDLPAYAPYLDITYAPAKKKPTTGPYDDTGHSIYGVSGSYVTSGRCNSRACNGDLKLATAKQIGASFFRVSVALKCDGNYDSGSKGYWSTFGKAGTAAFGNADSIYNMVSEAYTQRGLIPVVTFTAADAAGSPCLSYLGNPIQNPPILNNWTNEMTSFIS